VLFYMHRMTSFRERPQTCESRQERRRWRPAPGVGDGYWVQNWDITTPAMRCRAVKIDGKTITNR